MANLLQTILQIDSPLFKVGLEKLEKTTGAGAIDVRLIADIFHTAHKKMRLMKLDPKDTTAEELYHALQTSAKHKYVEQLFADCDFVLLIIDGEIISFNLIDIIENFHHNLSFSQRIISHGKLGLMGELLNRYVNHARSNEQTVRKIALMMGILEKV
jgi:hypothetical protein